jgi:hypothetical protein
MKTRHCHYLYNTSSLGTFQFHVAFRHVVGNNFSCLLLITRRIIEPSRDNGWSDNKPWTATILFSFGFLQRIADWNTRACGFARSNQKTMACYLSIWMSHATLQYLLRLQKDTIFAIECLTQILIILLIVAALIGLGSTFRTKQPSVAVFNVRRKRRAGVPQKWRLHRKRLIDCSRLHR